MFKIKPHKWLKAILFIAILAGTTSLQSISAQGLAGLQKTKQPEQNLFTEDDGVAYIEALEFCLLQVGSPVKFNQQQRQEILLTLNRSFNTLPLEIQLRLSNARTSWNHYQASWNYLSRDEQIDFVYGVIALAYGEQAAQKALNLIPEQPGESYQSKRDRVCNNNPGLCP